MSGFVEKTYFQIDFYSYYSGDQILQDLAIFAQYNVFLLGPEFFRKVRQIA
jgi:hypothetical protein